MIGIVVATHGELGRSLAGTLRLILGEIQGLAAVALESSDSLEAFQEKLEKALSEVDPKGEGSFVLVDMLGGTPFNVSFRLSQEKPIQLDYRGEPAHAPESGLAPRGLGHPGPGARGGQGGQGRGDLGPGPS